VQFVANFSTQKKRETDKHRAEQKNQARIPDPDENWEKDLPVRWGASQYNLQHREKKRNRETQSRTKELSAYF
jgi:hypothetical protein